MYLFLNLPDKRDLAYTHNMLEYTCLPQQAFSNNNKLYLTLADPWASENAVTSKCFHLSPECASSAPKCGLEVVILE